VLACLQRKRGQALEEAAGAETSGGGSVPLAVPKAQSAKTQKDAGVGNVAGKKKSGRERRIGAAEDTKSGSSEGDAGKKEKKKKNRKEKLEAREGGNAGEAAAEAEVVQDVELDGRKKKKSKRRKEKSEARVGGNAGEAATEAAVVQEAEMDGRKKKKAKGNRREGAVEGGQSEHAGVLAVQLGNGEGVRDGKGLQRLEEAAEICGTGRKVTTHVMRYAKQQASKRTKSYSSSDLAAILGIRAADLEVSAPC
jgi:hypothetical protein